MYVCVGGGRCGCEKVAEYPNIKVPSLQCVHEYIHVEETLGDYQNANGSDCWARGYETIYFLSGAFSG